MKTICIRQLRRSIVLILKSVRRTIMGKNKENEVGHNERQTGIETTSLVSPAKELKINRLCYRSQETMILVI